MKATDFFTYHPHVMIEENLIFKYS